MIIFYSFKLKLSNQKTTFVPHECEIYRQVTAFIVVFAEAAEAPRK